MEIRTLQHCSIDQILAAFNESFSDYKVPLQLTRDQLLNKMNSERVDLAWSVGAFRDDKLVGFILHGFDTISNKKILYNAGTGVIPAARGGGLSGRMYDFLMPSLRANQIDSVILEVITENDPAIRSYGKSGFRTGRRLICYKGGIKATKNEDVVMEEMKYCDWEKLRSFWDFTPTWQNSVNTIEKLGSVCKRYGAYINGQLAGYLVFNPVSKRVHQFGVDPTYRRQKIASTMFNHIGEPGNGISLINVEKNSTASNRFLESIGLVKFIEQQEMKLVLN